MKSFPCFSVLERWGADHCNSLWGLTKKPTKISQVEKFPLATSAPSPSWGNPWVKCRELRQVKDAKKAVQVPGLVVTAGVEELEGAQEAGGETDPGRRSDTDQVNRARIRKENISLRLEQAKLTGVNGFEVCSVILAKPSSLMDLFPSPIGKACV